MDMENRSPATVSQKQTYQQTMTSAEFFVAVYEMVELQQKWRDIYFHAKQDNRAYTEEENKILSDMQTITGKVNEELKRQVNGTPIYELAKKKVAMEELKKNSDANP